MMMMRFSGKLIWTRPCEFMMITSTANGLVCGDPVSLFLHNYSWHCTESFKINKYHLDETTRKSVFEVVIGSTEVLLW
jgi:hypothetical protein